MDNEQTGFELLVWRYLRGELQGHDYEELLEYLRDQENLSRFYRIKNEWIPEKDELAIKNWKRLERRMNQDLTVKHGSNSNSGMWFTRVAAVLVVCLMTSTVFFYLKSRNMDTGITVVETPRGEKSKVSLPDGTEVWLNASSRLSYQSFSSRSRQIKLEGEAYFKVKRDENSPFTVKTSRCDIQVLGTEFNVMAYDELKRDEITLFKGKINVATEKESAILNVGEKLLVSGDSFILKKVDLNQAYGWVENKFNFSKVTLDELIMRLENWYDVDIDCKNLDSQKTLFTGTFKNEETIREVLDAIKAYLPVTYKKTETRKIELMIK